MESTIIGYISGLCKGSSRHHSISINISKINAPHIYRGNKAIQGVWIVNGYCSDDGQPNEKTETEMQTGF